MKALTMANASSITPVHPPNLLKQLTTPTKHRPLFKSNNPHKLNRLSSFPTLASSLALPINVDYLKGEFGSSGVGFEGLGDGCVVKMGLQDGSTASLMLPSGLITSYKPRMWHGGNVEVLHTTVVEGRDGEAVVRGGASVDLSCIGRGGLSWSTDKWALLGVRGNSDEYIQVELISMGPKDTVEVKCLVTLQHDFLGSEIVIANRSSSHLELSGSVMNHLTVSTPDATFAIGLQGSSYRCRQPTVSDFSIIPPDGREKDGREKPLASWAWKGFDGLFSSRDDGRDRTDEKETIEEGEENDDCAQMTEKSSRVYSNPPRELTILDRGRRNSVVLRRSGFEELYIFSPGSDHEWYGQYAFVCAGPSAMLKPLALGPGDVWKGAQYLYNPNT